MDNRDKNLVVVRDGRRHKLVFMFVNPPILMITMYQHEFDATDFSSLKPGQAVEIGLEASREGEDAVYVDTAVEFSHCSPVMGTVAITFLIKSAVDWKPIRSV